MKDGVLPSLPWSSSLCLFGATAPKPLPATLPCQGGTRVPPALCCCPAWACVSDSTQGHLQTFLRSQQPMGSVPEALLFFFRSDATLESCMANQSVPVAGQRPGGLQCCLIVLRQIRNMVLKSHLQKSQRTQDTSREARLHSHPIHRREEPRFHWGEWSTY